jgi:hypothetical protein
MGGLCRRTTSGFGEGRGGGGGDPITRLTKADQSPHHSRYHDARPSAGPQHQDPGSYWMWQPVVLCSSPRHPRQGTGWVPAPAHGDTV